MSWNFHDEARVGAESALDACDYFVDEVIEPWKILGVLLPSVRAAACKSLALVQIGYVCVH